MVFDLKEAVICIPKFDGSHNHLQNFIAFIDLFAQGNENNVNLHWEHQLLVVVRMKFHGKALDKADNIIKETWNETKLALRNAFEEKLSIEQIIMEVYSLKQLYHESFEDYKERADKIHASIKKLGNNVYANRQFKSNFISGLRDYNVVKLAANIQADDYEDLVAELVKKCRYIEAINTSSAMKQNYTNNNYDDAIRYHSDDFNGGCTSFNKRHYNYSSNSNSNSRPYYHGRKNNKFQNFENRPQWQDRNQSQNFNDSNFNNQTNGSDWFDNRNANFSQQEMDNQNNLLNYSDNCSVFVTEESELVHSFEDFNQNYESKNVIDISNSNYDEHIELAENSENLSIVLTTAAWKGDNLFEENTADEPTTHSEIEVQVLNVNEELDQLTQINEINDDVATTSDYFKEEYNKSDDKEIIYDLTKIYAEINDSNIIIPQWIFNQKTTEEIQNGVHQEQVVVLKFDPIKDTVFESQYNPKDANEILESDIAWVETTNPIALEQVRTFKTLKQYHTDKFNSRSISSLNDGDRKENSNSIEEIKPFILNSQNVLQSSQKLEDFKRFRMKGS
ncbi:TBC1 domain family member 5 homolog A-like [Culex pipiens pallens]|uniref:TBC1 domain family member 5 homolog A-like n=1 Tax=Culex pipiens pallens TaxID=42434 RepID=UPI0022AB35AC|nr:TBC1 domain family member 5 homolog A-like [Culex pipiens pallens]